MAPSPLAVRDVVVPVPTALVPAFVDTNNTGLYSAVVLATIVLYDSREYFSVGMPCKLGR